MKIKESELTTYLFECAVPGGLPDTLWRAQFTSAGLRSLSISGDRVLNSTDSEELAAAKASAKNENRVKQLRALIVARMAGQNVNMDWPEFDLRGRGEFHVRVWKAMHAVPFGETRTYGEIADEAGSPLAFRACGQACGANPILLFIPCHRVLAQNGPGGFGGGLKLKERLLAAEGVTLIKKRED